MAFDSNSFVLDAALQLRSGTLKMINQTQKTNFGSISNVLFGFPVTKWWRTSLGVFPVSSVGYNIQEVQQVEGIGNTLLNYQGSGGLNKAYIGNAFALGKNFAIGANVSYIFGTIDKTRTVTFPDSVYYTNTCMKSSAQLSKVNYDFGIMYHKIFKSGYFIQAGITFTPSQTLDANADNIVYTFTRSIVNDRDIPNDTISFSQGASSSVKLPTSVGAGVMAGNGNRWLAMADVNWAKWSEFSYLGVNGGLKNNLRISVGGQFRQSPLDMGKYWQRVYFRTGLRYEESYLDIRNSKLNDFGISFGIGLPMKKSRSTINLAFEAGTQGTTANGLVRENYFRFTLGTALQERWFIKRRFN